jgi:hypothetical protein
MNNLEKQFRKVSIDAVKSTGTVLNSLGKMVEKSAEEISEYSDIGFETNIKSGERITSKDVLTNAENGIINNVKTISINQYIEEEKYNFDSKEMTQKLLEDDEIQRLLHNYKSYGLTFNLKLTSFETSDIELVETEVENVVEFIQEEEIHNSFIGMFSNITGIQDDYEYEFVDSSNQKLPEDLYESIIFASQNIEDKIDTIFDRLQEEILTWRDNYIKSLSTEFLKIEDKRSRLSSYLDKKILNQLRDDRVDEAMYEYVGILNKYTTAYNKMVQEKQDFLNTQGGDSFTRTINRAFWPREKQTKLLHLRAMYKTVKNLRPEFQEHMENETLIIIDDCLIDLIDGGNFKNMSELTALLKKMQMQPSLIIQELIPKFNQFVEEHIYSHDTKYTTNWKEGGK